MNMPGREKNLFCMTGDGLPVRISYLFSFVTAVVYGLVLDGFMALGALLPAGMIWQRIICYCLGMLSSSAGVSAMFHTYISPEVYELFVKEVSASIGANTLNKRICPSAGCSVSGNLRLTRPDKSGQTPVLRSHNHAWSHSPPGPFRPGISLSGEA